MASVIIVTPGDASANSYCSRAVADAYHENRLHAATWTDASDDTQDAALIMATRVLDQQFIWEGIRTFPTQRLDFPRDGLLTDEGEHALDSTTIPGPMQFATAEFGRLLIDSDTTVTSGTAGGAITSLKAGSVKIDYASGVVPHTDLIPDAVSACRVTGGWPFDHGSRLPYPSCGHKGEHKMGSWVPTGVKQILDDFLGSACLVTGGCPFDLVSRQHCRWCGPETMALAESLMSGIATIKSTLRTGGLLLPVEWLRRTGDKDDRGRQAVTSTMLDALIEQRPGLDRSTIDTDREDNTILTILDPVAITDADTFRWGNPAHTYKVKKIDGVIQNEDTGVRFSSEVTVIR